MTELLQASRNLRDSVEVLGGSIERRLIIIDMVAYNKWCAAIGDLAVPECEGNKMTTPLEDRLAQALQLLRKRLEIIKGRTHHVVERQCDAGIIEIDLYLAEYGDTRAKAGGESEWVMVPRKKLEDIAAMPYGRDGYMDEAITVACDALAVSPSKPLPPLFTWECDRCGFEAETRREKMAHQAGHCNEAAMPPAAQTDEELREILAEEYDRAFERPDAGKPFRKNSAMFAKDIQACLAAMRRVSTPIPQTEISDAELRKICDKVFAENPDFGFLPLTDAITVAKAVRAALQQTDNKG